MKKHGWQEGHGLGKKLQGRADPLQVNLFFYSKRELNLIVRCADLGGNETTRTWSWC